MSIKSYAKNDEKYAKERKLLRQRATEHLMGFQITFYTILPPSKFYHKLEMSYEMEWDFEFENNQFN